MERIRCDGPKLPSSIGALEISGTVRYLGIEVDDALAIAEQVDV